MKISYLDAEYVIYPKNLFKTIDEIREEKINILLENETYSKFFQNLNDLLGLMKYEK
jgi:hypothetical protein